VQFHIERNNLQRHRRHVRENAALAVAIVERRVAGAGSALPPLDNTQSPVTVTA
jgi:hypothetical protein